LPECVRARNHVSRCEKCFAYLHGYERTIEFAKRAASGRGVSALPEDLVRKILAARHRP